MENFIPTILPPTPQETQKEIEKTFQLMFSHYIIIVFLGAN